MTGCDPRTTALREPGIDPFGRKIDYLRISVTDRCNERCLYCMPEGYKGWSRRPDHLTAGDIVRVARAATGLGFRKFRITGGEPLLRGDLIEIASGIASLAGVTSLSLSTNATRLAPMAAALRSAGIRSVNVSLDALDPDRYRQITGAPVEPVLAGIDAAQAAGFSPIKLNTVLLRGMNESEIEPLLRFAADRDLPIRFIELMPLTRADVLDAAQFLPVREVMDQLDARGGLDELGDWDGKPSGHGPARYYRHRATGATVGFIGAITQEDFCASCNKLRLTADGKLRPCLGRHGEIDLRAGLSDPGALDALLREAIANKPENHTFDDAYEPQRPMTAIGG